ncbi:MAG: 3-hydroxyacyl-CoA dehydrogenase NAD-binding domain-containing protein [Pseudomonadota bacterium]
MGNAHDIAILGAGSIGVSFAAVFVDAGARVTLVDPDAARRAAVAQAIKLQQEATKEAGLRKGGQGTLSVVAELGAAAADARLVLECGPERLNTKQQIFANLLSATPATTLLATASSAIPMSHILPAGADQARCLVAHPVNPPAILRLIELAPAPGTLPETVSHARGLFRTLGFAPVVLHREVEGFVLNRLQGAVLREAYRLVDEGVASAEDIDTVMRVGLGPRWALSGPFETAELNTPGGLAAHAARMGPAYKRMGEARGETVDWSPALVAQAVAARRAILPEAQIPARAAWRVGAVARLVAERDRILADADD